MGTAQTWDWKIAGYLFLAGTGAGAFLIAVGGNLAQAGAYQALAQAVAFLGVVLVGLGALLLIADLGYKLRFWRVMSNPTSLISIGSWLIAGFLLSGLAYGLWPGSKMLAWLGVVTAIGTAGYTGVLLGVVKARPFWNTPLLPVLFLVSSLSTGIALVLITARWAVLPAATWLAPSDLGLLVLEAVLVGFYLLIMAQSTVTAVRSAREVLWGRWRIWFWVGTVLIGLLLPLAILIWGGAGRWPVLAACLVLAGGACLRYWVLRAGARRPLPGEGWQDVLI